MESALGKGSKFSFTARFGVAAKLMKAAVPALPDLAGFRRLVVAVSVETWLLVQAAAEAADRVIIYEANRSWRIDQLESYTARPL